METNPRHREDSGGARDPRDPADVGTGVGVGASVCLECGASIRRSDRAWTVPVVCPRCAFWLTRPSKLSPEYPFVYLGVVYWLDGREEAEGVGPLMRIRPFHTAREIVTRRLRLVGEPPPAFARAWTDTAVIEPFQP